MHDDHAAPVVEPRMLRRDNGGWLAVAPDGAPFRIGVAAWSADEAKRRFDREMKEWVVLSVNQDV